MKNNLTTEPMKNKLSWMKSSLAKVAAGAMMLVLGSVAALAQTAPTAQSLPYSQNWGTATFTTMPTGWAAWTAGGNKTTQAAAESGTPAADDTVTAATASQTGGGIYGYATSSNGRLYLQESSNATRGTPTVAFAFNTGNNTVVSVSYDLELINGGVTTQDYGHELQYRAGTSGSWTAITGSAMTFGAVTTYTTTTRSFTVSGLTANTDYQIRIITWRPSGSGNSKGIGIDNFKVSTVPSVTSSAATSVTGTTATLNGNVTLDGNSAITERGFVYKDNVSGATITDNKTTVSGTTGSYTLALSSLSPGHTYYFKAYAINSVGTTLSSELSFTTPGGTPPTLTAAGSATVDSAFNVTFTDDSAWRAAITSITVGGTTLSGAAYSVSAGQIAFTPSASTLLQSSGTKSIAVQATGYTDATVSQAIGFGAASKLGITTQPTAPSVNGGALAAQPVVVVQDQYGNTVTSSSASIGAATGQGGWTLSGTLSVAASSGVATFAGLTATANTSISGATIDFTSGSLTHIVSSSFNIPAPAPPTLTAASGVTVDSAFTVTFTDNSSWRSAITSITVGGLTLSPTAYSVSASQITFTPSADALLQSAGTKSIVVIATGFANDNLSQAIGFGAATKLGIITQPTAPAANGSALAAQPVVAVQDQYGNTVTTSSASITAAAVQGTWTLGGTLTVSASSGLATFSGLTASASGAVSGVTIDFTSTPLTHVTSGSFNIPAPAPALTEVFVPQYIQGIASGTSNGKRVPYAYRATLYNLTPNATYRYFNQCVDSSDGATASGAGNVIFVTSSGAFVRTTSTGFVNAGQYGEFTADGSGSYTGWFINEPTGNSPRFNSAGHQIQMRITLNDGANGTTPQTYLTTASFVTVTVFNTTGANTGTGIRGTSFAAAKNFVMLYDNTAGTGRPIAGTVVEDDGAAAAVGSSGYATFYANNVDAANGAWGSIIPNSLANGIRRIENRAKSNGSLVFANTDSDGVWPSGVNTVNPSGGDATPLVITTSDAPLAQATITGAATATAFTTTYGTASAVQTFAVSGANLTANITATAPTGFEVSSGGAYGSTATFTQSGGTASGTLSVRLAATAPVSGSYDSKAIALTSGTATEVDITTAASGNAVSAATLTYTANAASMTYGGTVPSLSGTVSGFVNGENQAGATTGTLAFTTSADSSSPAGSYAINGSGLTAANYTFVQAAGNTTALTVYEFTTSALTLTTSSNTAATVSYQKLATHVHSTLQSAVYPASPWTASVTTPATHGTAAFSVNGTPTGSLTYTPGSTFAGGADSFTVTFGDGFATQTMLVSVTVTTNGVGGQSANAVLVTTDGSGHSIVRFAGLPGTNYTVETNSASSGSGWVKEGFYTAPTDNSLGFGVGVFQVSDPLPPSPGELFYRTVTPAY